mmetsp:Transcript_15382/g.23835  ORF Transcript_15382/g.23835 Transcript_15382/m.23835 type:complete len:149 (+) Transcript_15382:96-542(+)
MQSARRLNLWRVDPTGQFWSCDAAAVGKGSGDVEKSLMQKIVAWKLSSLKGNEGNDISVEDMLSSLSNGDTVSYLGPLSVGEALKVACDCLIEVVGKNRKVDKSDDRISSHSHWNRIQAVIMNRDVEFGGDQYLVLNGNQVRDRVANL